MRVYIYTLIVFLVAQFPSSVSARKIVADGMKVKISYFKKTASVIGPENRKAFNLDSLFIPESFSVKGRDYRTISVGGFANCKSLVYVSLPSTVENLERACFQGCSNIETLEIPPLVKNIPEAFIEMTTDYVMSDGAVSSKLKRVTLGENLITIGNWAFSGNSLQKIVIPENVKSIGTEALSSLRTLTDVYCLSTTPPSIHIEYTDSNRTEIMDWSFQFIGPHNPGLDPSRTLYVPVGSLQAYQNAPGWCSFDKFEEILVCGPEFDPEAFRLPEGTTIRDVILKLPGTTIDSLNNIYVGGKLVSNKLFEDKHSTQYVTYCDEVKYKLNLTVSVPESSMLFCENTPNNTVFFGPMLPEFRTLPIFESGPVVQLTEHCQVLLMTLAYQQKPRPESYPLVRPGYVPPVDGWMLNNCKVPWANWYLTNTGGVVIKDVSEEEKREAEETRLEAVRKAQEMRAKYETTVSDTVLLNQVNCNSIYIAQLPNIETIQCSDQALIANESLNQRLKKDCTSCYAVEFYKSSSFIGFDMIFFISGQENKTITDYVALLAKYLNFN